MMVEGDEAGFEDAADVFDIFEAERCVGKLAVGYLCIDHLVNSLADRLLGELTEAA